MYCDKCGAKISESAKFCPECGNFIDGSKAKNNYDIDNNDLLIEKIKSEDEVASKRKVESMALDKKDISTLSKLILKDIGISLIWFAAMFFLYGIIGAVISMCFTSKGSDYLNGWIYFALYTVIAIVCAGFISQIYFANYSNAKYMMDIKDYEENINSGKNISSGGDKKISDWGAFFRKLFISQKHIKTFWLCLPFLFCVVIGLVCIAIVITNMTSYNEALLFEAGEVDSVSSKSATFAILKIILLLDMGYAQFFGGLLRVSYFLMGNCIKCGNCYTRIKIEEKDFHSSNWTEYKSKTRSETVGSIYADNEKIADVTRDVTDNYSRDVHAWSQKILCKCCYCGKKTQHIEGERFAKDWKKE